MTLLDEIKILDVSKVVAVTNGGKRWGSINPNWIIKP